MDDEAFRAHLMSLSIEELESVLEYVKVQLNASAAKQEEHD